MEKYYYVSFGADVYYDVDGEKYVRCGEDDISEYDTVIKCDQSEINDKADAILCDIPTYPEIMRLYEVEGPNGIPYDGQECDSARYFVRYSGEGEVDDDGNDPTAVDPQTGLTQGDDADPITTALGWYPDWVDGEMFNDRNATCWNGI